VPPPRDLYEILGVSRTATPEEVKRAYRRLAKQYHPDVNPGKASEEKFKEVTAAFEVLGDEKRRKLYDEFGADSLRTGFDEKRAEEVRRWRRQGAPAGSQPFDFGDFATVDVGRYGAFDFGSLFGDLFGDIARGGRGTGSRGRGAARPAAGADAEARIEIPLRDAVLGAERDVRVDGKTLRVRIPAGVSDGARIRLAGQGAPGARGGAAGDLFLEVKLLEHPHVRRDGKDLLLDLPVTVGEALDGAEVRLPTFEGPVSLRVPKAAQSGMRLRLRGKGLPDLHGGPRGDLYAVVQVVLPPATDAAREAARALAALYDGDPRAGISL
jgi:curved DNA-binding protein